jgi:hypothetical protein
MIVVERPRSDLAGVKQVSLAGEEPIKQVAHAQAVVGLPAGVQVVALIQVLRQGAVRVFPRPEVVELAIDFLGPALGCVGKLREIQAGFRGLVLRSATGRMRYGDDSARAAWCQNRCQEHKQTRPAMSVKYCRIKTWKA